MTRAIPEVSEGLGGQGWAPMPSVCAQGALGGDRGVAVQA